MGNTSRKIKLSASKIQEDINKINLLTKDKKFEKRAGLMIEFNLNKRKKTVSTIFVF